AGAGATSRRGWSADTTAGPVDDQRPAANGRRRPARLCLADRGRPNSTEGMGVDHVRRQPEARTAAPGADGRGVVGQDRPAPSIQTLLLARRQSVRLSPTADKLPIVSDEPPPTEPMPTPRENKPALLAMVLNTTEATDLSYEQVAWDADLADRWLQATL